MSISTRIVGDTIYTMYPPYTKNNINRWQEPNIRDKAKFWELFRNLSPFRERPQTLAPKQGDTHWRIDLQGIVDDYLNIQFQVGNITKACVFMHKKCSLFTEWEAFFRKAFRKSLQSGVVYQIDVKSEKKRKPPSGPDPYYHRKEYERLNKVIKAIDNSLKLAKAEQMTIKVFLKNAPKEMVELAAKITGKYIPKAVVKEIPIFSLLAGISFANWRFKKGEVTSGIEEILSGIAGCIPGLGSGFALLFDADIVRRDIVQAIEEYHQVIDAKKETLKKIEKEITKDYKNRQYIKDEMKCREQNEIEANEELNPSWFFV